eukprot:1156973-Pelagomonas_calceolata.AAC.13
MARARAHTQTHTCTHTRAHACTQVAQLEAELAAEREQARKMSVELSAARQRLTHAEATSEARGAEISKLARQRDEAQGSLKHSTEELIAEQLRNKQQVRKLQWGDGASRRDLKRNFQCRMWNVDKLIYCAVNACGLSCQVIRMLTHKLSHTLAHSHIGGRGDKAGHSHASLADKAPSRQGRTEEGWGGSVCKGKGWREPGSCGKHGHGHMCAPRYKADVQRLKQENGELVRMAEELMCSLEKERQKNRAAGRS